MRIIVGLDGSGQALLGARWVASLPLSWKDEVILVSVVARPTFLSPWVYAVADTTGRVLAAPMATATEAARTALDRAAGEFAGRACAISVAVLEGHPTEALRDAVREREADMLVLGPHGHGRLASVLLGSVSQSLLHDMPTSLLVARAPVGSPRTVLLAVDGSPQSLTAARFLAAIPLRADVRIEIVTVLDTHWSTAEGAADQRDWMAAERRHAAEAIAEAQDVLSAAGRTGTPVTRHGSAAAELLAAATGDRADLIVLGARGIGGFQGLVLGSVSRAVSKAAGCSTLVVPS